MKIRGYAMIMHDNSTLINEQLQDVQNKPVMFPD